jgi:glycosyltransferase involved in cell wall biosynthesis
MRRGRDLTTRPVRVVIVQEVVLQYRRNFYELLRDRLARAGIELTLVHSNPRPDDDVWGDAIDLPWATRVEVRRFPIGDKHLVWQRCGALLRDSDLIIVEQGSRHLINYLLAVQQLAGRRHLAYWGHGRNLQNARVSHLGEWAKAHLTRVAHWWFAYTESSAEVVAAEGFPRDRITVVQNAVDTRELAAAVAGIDPGASQQHREELGLTGRHVGVFVGGLASGTKLPYLFAAADTARARVDDFELVVAGAGPQQPWVREAVRERPWARYVGPRFGAEKAGLLRLADVLLAPAAAGLVLLDAFAAGVPPVVSASQAHGPELSYVEDGVNGLIVDDDGDPRRFGEAVAALLGDDQRRADLGSGCRRSRERYTVEEMVSRFASGVEQALAG